jgi:predicted carbohydrate-binding protein with CBM5 and CBM33 domain
MDKTGRTGTRAQLVNGALLVSSFFLVRIVYGGWVVRLVCSRVSVGSAHSMCSPRVVVGAVFYNTGAVPQPDSAPVRAGVRDGELCATGP